MTFRGTDVAWQRSAEIRAARKELRLAVGALTPPEATAWMVEMLRNPAPPADGVRLHELIRWLPGVGSVKADRLLSGFDGAQRLGNLTEQTRTDLAGRIARRSRRAKVPEGVSVKVGE